MSEDEAFNAIVHLLLDENTTAGVRDILRAYGDARERAGLERAADYARTLPVWRMCAEEVAREIDTLPVPAPDAGGAVRETKNAES